MGLDPGEAEAIACALETNAAPEVNLSIGAGYPYPEICTPMELLPENDGNVYRDEIIDEVWKNRDSYTAKHHHNLAEMVADLKNKQEKPGVSSWIEETEQSARHRSPRLLAPLRRPVSAIVRHRSRALMALVFVDRMIRTSGSLVDC